MNNTPARILNLAAILLAALMAAALPAAAQQQPISPQDEARLKALAKNFQPVTDRTVSRSIFTFALCAAELGWRPDIVEEALAVAEKMQDRDPQSRTYGNFRWYWHNEKPADLNAVEFCMEHGVLIWMFHRDKLTPKAKESLERLIRLSVEGIRRQGVGENYTNIYLMKTWNCIAIGENCAMPGLAEEGYKMLDRWLGYTWEAGIHEYLSPTYYGVDLPCVAKIANYAKRERERKLADAILRLFWSDIALNWYPPAQRLGGAHSRDYDYVTGHGMLDRYVMRNAKGWGEPEPGRLEERVLQKYDDRPAPDGIRNLMTTPRFVRQSFGPAPFENAAQYVGSLLSIGSAGANYSAHEKILAVNLPGGPREPIMYYLMDARQDPYGQVKFLEGKGGHQKALHVQPFVTRVQSGPEVLLLSSISPEDRRFDVRAPNATCLLSHLVMPAEVRMYTGPQGDVVECVDRIPVGNVPFFIRKGKTAVAMRFLIATGPDGKPAPIELFTDGGDLHTMRLTAIHSTVKPTRRATTAIWVRAAENLDDAAFAEFRRAFAAAEPKISQTDGRIDIAVPGIRNPLRIVADVERDISVLRQGEEPKSEEVILAVDGRDIGREILKDLEPVARFRRMLAAEADGGTVMPAEKPFEAEATEMILEPFIVQNGNQASGGKFVWVPNNYKGGGGIALARIVYFIDVPRDGTYYLMGRLLTPTPDDDSFFIEALQNGTPVLPQFDWHTGVHKQWEWTAVTKNTAPLPIALKKGPVKLIVRCREDGAAIDAIALTANPNWKAPAR